MAMKRLLLVCIPLAVLPIVQVPRKTSSETMIRSADRAAQQFFTDIGQPSYLKTDGRRKVSLGRHRYGETVIRLDYRHTNLTIEPIAGDILYVSLPHDRSPGTGKVLDRKAILAFADKIVRLRLPPDQRHLCKAELIAPGSDRLDISRSRGLWFLMYREAPGDLPAIDSNMATLSFDATSGELIDYYEIRGFKKVGPSKPKIAALEARRIVEAMGMKHTTKYDGDQRNRKKATIRDIVLGWSAVVPQYVPGATGRELRLSYEVRLSDDRGVRVDAQTGKVIGIMGLSVGFDPTTWVRRK